MRKNTLFSETISALTASVLIPLVRKLWNYSWVRLGSRSAAATPRSRGCVGWRITESRVGPQWQWPIVTEEAVYLKYSVGTVDRVPFQPIRWSSITKLGVTNEDGSSDLYGRVILVWRCWGKLHVCRKTVCRVRKQERNTAAVWGSVKIYPSSYWRQRQLSTGKESEYEREDWKISSPFFALRSPKFSR